MRDVEDQVLTLFRRMISRGRQRKIPLEKIQTEISSVRSEQSNVKTKSQERGKSFRLVLHRVSKKYFVVTSIYQT